MEQEFNEILDKYNHLNDDFLTEKEISNFFKQIDVIIGTSMSPNYKKMTLNNMRNMILSMANKIEKRKTIPNWYYQNKL